MNKYITVAIAAIPALMGLIGMTTPASATDTSDCSPPVDYDERFLIERCNEGHYLIDKEDGSKAWVSSQGGVNKSCEYKEDGSVQCIQTP